MIQSILLLTLSWFSVPADGKHWHSLMLPPPYFTIRMVFSCSQKVVPIPIIMVVSFTLGTFKAHVSLGNVNIVYLRFKRRVICS